MRDVRLNDVSKRYGGQTVLRGFSLVLPAGGRLALTGPSGSGKTTATRLLMGLETPDTGTVETGGARFCCVFQEDRLAPGLSAAANVALVLPQSGWPKVAGLLAQVGLSGEEIQKPVAQLSGGQKRRVALVRALAAPGDVVVLDEAFKELDAPARRVCYRFVNDNLAGRSLLLITHDAADVKALAQQQLQLAPVAGQAKAKKVPAAQVAKAEKENKEG